MAGWEDPADGEFFINLKDNTHLDRSEDSGWELNFTVFAEVEKGLEVADAISRCPARLLNGMSMLEPAVRFLALAVLH